MNTWRLLTALAAFLGVMLAFAIWSQPSEDLGGRTKLVWASDNNPSRADQIEAFNREHPQDKVELDYGNAGMQKILLQCSSGIGPDIFDIYTDEMEAYAESGVLWDVTDAAKSNGFSAATDCWPGAEDETIYQGRQYAYPCNIGTCLLIYNKNVFDYYGVPYPVKIETWDQLIELGRKVSSAGTGREGPDGAIFGVSRLNWQDYFASQQGEYFDQGGHLLDLTKNAELRKAFEWHRDLIFKYHLTPTSVQLQVMGGQGGWGSSEFNEFAAGKFAMISAGNYSLLHFGRVRSEQLREVEASGQKLSDIHDPLKKPLRLGSVLLPGLAGRPPCYQTVYRLAGINPYSPHRKEALAFLQYLAGPTYAGLVNRDSDLLPGNAKYADIQAPTVDDELSTAQMHQLSAKAMTFSYSPRKSPYLLTSDILGVIMGEISRLESDPQISTDELLKDGQRQIERLLQRNLSHDPALKQLYEQASLDASAAPKKLL